MSNFNEQMIPINIIKGATFPLVVKYLDSCQEPIDLTGYDSYMEIKDTYGANASLIENPSTSGVYPYNNQITIDPSGGVISVMIPPSGTSQLNAPSQATYLLWLLAPGGTIVNRILKGPASISY